LKTIQEILRHAHISTTADIYVKESQCEQREGDAEIRKEAQRLQGGGRREATKIRLTIALSCSELALKLKRLTW
jgi:hypothetical protein